MSDQPSRLRQFIVRHHSLEELRTLCFDLRVDYDDLGGEGKNAKVRELLLRLGREHKLDQLLDELHRTRAEPLRQAGFGPDPSLLAVLYLQLRPREERTLLKKVKTFWVKDVLEYFLYGAGLIELGMELRPEAIADPWEKVVPRVDSGPQVLPEDKHIIDVFDEADRTF